jgi:preprotein translocase subunit SecE
MIAQRTESIRRLVRESISEAKKVNWPDQETTRNLTVVVIAISVILGLLLGGIDFALVKLLDVF